MDDKMVQAKSLSEAYAQAIQRGDLKKAFELASEEALLRSNLDKESGRRWETDLALARAAVNAGTLALDLGDLGSARGFLSDAERAFAFSRKAYPEGGADSSWESTRNRLGREALAGGDAPRALSMFLEILERRKRRYSREGNKHDAKYSLAVSGNLAALASLKCGDQVAALGRSDTAISILRHLVALFPENRDFLLELAWGLVLRCQIDGRRLDAMEEAKRILTALAASGRRDDKFWRVSKEAGMDFQQEVSEVL